jgi:hypothetical protein
MMVKVGEITAIEAHGDYTRILLNEGKNLMMKQTLSLWESQLPAGLFVKMSRSLLVNTQSVAKLVRKNLLTWELQLQGAKEPIKLSNLESKRLRAVLEKAISLEKWGRPTHSHIKRRCRGDKLVAEFRNAIEAMAENQSRPRKISIELRRLRAACG